MICSATAGIMFVIIGIAATSRATNHDDSASSCFVPLLCRPNGATPHQSTRAPRHRGGLNSFILLPQCFFKALLCFCRERCVRDLADFFGKLAGDFAHIFELLRVALAK